MIKTNLRTVRVIMADDHALLREGFRNMLHRYEEIEFIGEAENGRELIPLVRQLKPDIIFTDINMPFVDGIEATRAIRKEFPDIGVIALTNFDDDHLIVDMLEAGAKGYIVKSAGPAEILDATHTVYDGGTYYCRHTSSKLMKMIADSKFNPHRITRPEFNDREKDVIRMVCQEYSNKQMASCMNLSIRTIEGYREKIQQKMNVQSTVGLVVYAIKRGLFKP
jgi:DNA-binding NarL/FixJ family response regulator